MKTLRLLYNRYIAPLVCAIRGHVARATVVSGPARLQDFLDGNGPTTGVPMRLCWRCWREVEA